MTAIRRSRNKYPKIETIGVVGMVENKDNGIADDLLLGKFTETVKNSKTNGLQESINKLSDFGVKMVILSPSHQSLKKNKGGI